jgi:hypothetical protein
MHSPFIENIVIVPTTLQRLRISETAAVGVRGAGGVRFLAGPDVFNVAARKPITFPSRGKQPRVHGTPDLQETGHGTAALRVHSR